MRLEFYLLKIHFEQSDRQKLNFEQKKNQQESTEY